MLVANAVSALLAHVDDLRGSGCERVLVFRGETRDDWPLLPMAGRPDFRGLPWESRFDSWRSKASAIKRLPGNEWRQLALAQHHGLATPLLDWTTNPLVAAYFAARRSGDADSDGVVHCFRWALGWDPTVQKGKPKDVKVILGLGGNRLPFPLIKVHQFSDRMRAQAGVFTIHGDDTKCMREFDWPYDHKMNDGSSHQEDLATIRIPSNSKSRILADLASLDIGHSKLFPDLDGVSEEVNNSPHP